MLLSFDVSLPGIDLGIIVPAMWDSDIRSILRAVGAWVHHPLV